jgi:hypothetical protein
MYVTHMMSQYKHNIPTFSGNIKSTDARFHFVSKAHINIFYMPTMYTYCLYVEFLKNAIYCLFINSLFINESIVANCKVYSACK